ncbi:MAG: prolyl hydroxylase family protein [Aestuariibacter sp.]
MHQPEPVLPANTKQWIIKQLFSGAQPMTLLKQLLADGFTFEAITKALGTNLPKGLTYNRDMRFFQTLAERPFLTHKNLIDYSNDDVQLYAVPEFLCQEECDLVIRHAVTDLKPSRVADNDNYRGHRTSTTAELSFMQRPELLAVEKKIIDFMALGVGENEVMQAQHYAPGQEFKAHTDYFLPGAKEYKADARKRGQRTWTFMLYLNEHCSGGETEFIKLDRRFTPETGKALIWNNLYPNGCPNPNTLHCSKPVISGEKVIITKWFRTFD